jgi:hypothetical protein
MTHPTLICAFIARLVNIAADLAAATYADADDRICDQIARPPARARREGGLSRDQRKGW